MDTPGPPAWRRALSRRSVLRRTALLGTAALGVLLSSTACRGSAASGHESAFVSTKPLSPSPSAVPPRPGPSLPYRAVETPIPTTGAAAAPLTTGEATVTPPTPVAALATSAVVAPAPQPNVLLVTIDTLRADRIGAYGFGPAHTPVLDQLAREGVRFDHAICQLPQTDPSHTAMMTGLYASTSGVRVHMTDKLRAGAQTAATIFQSAGYQTAGFYSWLSLDGRYCGLDQGFQTYEGYVFDDSKWTASSPNAPLAANFQDLRSQVSIVKTTDVNPGAYADYELVFDGRSDVTNQAVFAWLDSHAGLGPFFLWIHYFDCHVPYAPPAGYDHIWGLNYQGNIDGAFTTLGDLYSGKLQATPADIARIQELYQGEIAFVDAQLGQLLARLNGLGIKDQTIIAVTGDHGESFGEHGDWLHGLKVFESEIRVPLLLRYPSRLPAGTRVSAPAQHIDVLPTLLELSGLSAKQPIQGTSLLPVIGPDTDASSRVAFTELANEAFVSVLTWGDWKLIRNNANDQLQLYNLNLDESEQQNLAGDQLKITAELHARLLDLMKISGVSR
ncbi:MAG TPA: sulfatase-like hydrolase/transferase [Chloroflexota bacterium]|nr:sulfatase-like hydrolase/transferase [Chloroflexota bacterium]